ncbi:MAG TPA: amidohydrolase family protein [Spirochaetia bacterium]|nr:amidohydrolase family protein [Spirochaetia bacterium]
MFIDVHVHPAFYEPIRADAARQDARHELLGLYHNGTAPLEHVFNQMSCAGLDRLCLLAQDYSADSAAVVSNEEVARLVGLAPNRFIGIASIDPFAPGCLEKLERAFTEHRLRGLKLHPGRQGFYPPDPRLDPVYALCERHDRPVIFHSGLSLEPDSLAKYSRPAEFEELAYRHPKLRICLAHFGWPWVQEAAMLMLKYRNVYADTALLYFDSAKEFYARVFTRDLEITWIDRSLRHQVMFGSDNPRFEQIRMARALGELGLRESSLELIKGVNAAEFLGGID